MFNMKVNKLFLFVLLGALTVTSISCEPLRKKFVRKKKQVEDNTFVPVLEPMEYPASVKTAEDRYKQFYSLYKIWARDLLEALNDPNSKRQDYLFNQTTAQLEEMKKWVTEDKQIILNDILKDLESVRQEFAKPAPMRSQFAIKKILNASYSTVINKLNPKVMQDAYKESVVQE